MQKIIVSGIQPSGELHIGNYLGALQQLLTLQENNEHKLYFFVADYHSLTENSLSAQEKKEQIVQLIINLVSIGIDPQKTIFFIQSHVPETTELAWYF